jgi:predicted membrane chloride channel (bestrophin family)
MSHFCVFDSLQERIYNSPVPLVYTRHTARFLGFWILALPMALFESFGTSWNHIGLLPAAILISFFFFGIEELAIQLEEPFTILPLKQLVDGIGVSVDDTVEWFVEDEKTTRQKELITSSHGEREPVGVHNKLLSKFRT